MAHSQRGTKMLNIFLALSYCLIALSASVLIVFLMDIILLRSIRK
jgi:hypothetical protein